MAARFCPHADGQTSSHSFLFPAERSLLSSPLSSWIPILSSQVGIWVLEVTEGFAQEFSISTLFCPFGRKPLVFFSPGLGENPIKHVFRGRLSPFPPFSLSVCSLSFLMNWLYEEDSFFF